MQLATAKKVFANLMQVSRERELGPIEKRTLIRARQTLRKHAKPAMNAKRVYSRGAVKIYGRCLRIEAVKMKSHLYGGKKTPATQRYFHDFTTKNAMIYGLPDGSLLIKAR